MFILRVSGMLEKKCLFCVCQVCLKRKFLCVCQVCLKRNVILLVSGMLEKNFFCVCLVCLKRFAFFVFACVRYF